MNIMGLSTDPIASHRGYDETRPVEGPEKEAILRELESILSSPFFRGSERSKQFLSYVVQHGLKGNHERLKERTIGADLFERPAGYSTGDDPVVRVQAGEVRRRLAQYYQASTNHSPIHIELHAGSYTPEFHWNQVALPPEQPPHPQLVADLSAGAALTHEDAPLVTAPPIAQAAAVKRDYRALMWVLPVVCALVALALILTYSRGARAPQSVLSQFWSPVFATSGPVLICLANPPTYRPTPELYQKYAKDPSAFATQSQRFSQPPPLKPNDKLVWGDMVEYPDFGVAKGDVYAAIRLSALFGRIGKESQVRIGNDDSFEDLRNSPSILVGAFNNRWTMLIMSRLHFAFAEDNGDPIIRENGGAGRAWRAKTGRNHLVFEDYGVVTRLVNSDTGQFVVVVAGIKANGTEAAGEFASNSDGLEKALRTAPADWSKKNLQIVVQTTVTDAVNGPPRAVAIYTW
jgi:hypothetical protein